MNKHCSKEVYTTNIRVSAVHIGDSIALKPMIKSNRESIVMRNPLIVQWKKKNVVIFPFGVVVFWDFSANEEQRFFADIAEHIVHVQESPLRETGKVEEGSQFSFRDDRITVPSIDSKSIAVISLILARSLGLEKQELNLEKLTLQFQPLVTRKKSSLLGYVSNRKMLRISGEAMDVHQITSISMSMLDTPDLVWDDTDLCDFYKDLLEEYEIEMRHKQLTYKLELLMQHSEFILHLLEARKSFWLEVTIIVLIAVEIVLFVYDLWGAA
ncbi:hypothetical protein COU78_01355 [Candidatus Peregrinibacteria bacterium CG10_big_fil_rev_8_21_14_0_10_49_24]|nr:MAG: hypothetical protein COV83_04320 [Candidatus Peregrinibacteria bacterium CG11_big_fil_rev_8_21_14_0_20_49_14]PIR51372.1 MAG: hypothetical protein COU78_01355 [Candidatus Peregrinibacteria bacterium CG10_big_fil_rev_8_21_14_0_10_49_24]PJA68136.1 MAG: hypothetical protein CO157_01170 [Candidatus Peregrinibacteria bacterium CG_4_9_14_3_um_filter_49_12]